MRPVFHFSTRLRGFAASALLLSPLPALTGCIKHTYSVAKVQAPSAVKDATADQLVQSINNTATSIHTLKASVDFSVSVGGSKKGTVTDYTSFSGYILLRTPENLRVLGLLPVVHTQAFDLASDGTHFTLVIPPKSKAYTGLNAVTKPSAGTLQNLRPNIFFDTVIPQAIQPEDLYNVTAVAPTTIDPKTHQLIARPEYELTILRKKPDSQELVPERRIHFDRTTLLPSGVDIYNKSGDIETQATYGAYKPFGEVQYPESITINRPIDEYQIVVTIDKLTTNQPLADNQFQLKIPDGYTVQQLN